MLQNSSLQNKKTDLPQLAWKSSSFWFSCLWGNKPKKSWANWDHSKKSSPHLDQIQIQCTHWPFVQKAQYSQGQRSDTTEPNINCETIQKWEASESFSGFFQDIPFDEQKSRDDDYNLKQTRATTSALLYFPSCQIIRSWNQNNILLKSEADITNLKEDFVQKKMNTYDEECVKPNCYMRRQDRDWFKGHQASTNLPCLVNV